MKIVVTLESGRVMVSNLDLDGNAFLYELKSTREPNYNIQNCDIYVNSFNAYIGEMAHLIKHERPGIPIARDVFNHLTDSEYTYTEQNGRKWNATLLTALVIKRLIQKIEESVTKRIQEVSFVVHPNIQNAQIQRELKTALSYYKLTMGEVYNHSSAILSYHSRKNNLDGEHFLVTYFDSNSFYLQILYCDGSKNFQKSYKDGNQYTINHCQKAIHEIVLNKVTDALTYTPRLTAKNALVLESIVQDVYRAFFLRSTQELNKPIFIDSKPCILKFTQADFQMYWTELKDHLSLEIVKCLDEAAISYKEVSKIFLCGEFSNTGIITSCVEDLFDTWKDKIIADEFQVAKGGAYLLHGNGSNFDVEPFKKEENKSGGTTSNIQLQVEGAEEYIVFEDNAKSDYTSLTVNLSAYEEYFSDSEEIVFEHYIIEENQRKNIGEIHILHDVDIYPAQLQLNIIRKGQKFNSIQAIDFENDQILTVEYYEGKKPLNNDLQEESLQEVMDTNDKPAIKIKTKTRSEGKAGITLTSKPKIKVKTKTEKVSSDIKILDKSPVIKVNKDLTKKVKIEIKNDEIKDKFQEILEIIMINNTK